MLQQTESASPRKPLTLHRLREMHVRSEKIVMLTCYDATFARLLDAAGVDCLLVGDSLAMVLQGQSSTMPVTLEEMAYHTRCVARGNQTAWVVGDPSTTSRSEARSRGNPAAAVSRQRWLALRQRDPCYCVCCGIFASRTVASTRASSSFTNLRNSAGRVPPSMAGL